LVDDGVSGGRRERLVRLDAALRATGARIVVVYHLDRLARDAAALLDWLERAGRRGVELHVVGRGRIETQTASGYLVAGVEGIVAAHYRKLVSEKTRDALARLRSRGRRTSRWAPYGYRFGPDHRLVPDAPERAVLAKIASLASGGGLSLRSISRTLAANGLMARNGRPFAPMTLSRLVTN
jgi:site-specific DNA recombinase